MYKTTPTQFYKDIQYEQKRVPKTIKLLNKVCEKAVWIDDIAWQKTFHLDGYIFFHGKKYWFDAKNVRNKYQHIFVETETNGGKNNGWLYHNIHRKNVLIIYGFDLEGQKVELWFIPLHKLRSYVQQNKDKLKYTTKCDTGYGYLVPLSEIKKFSAKIVV